jgi:hypothetical protein
MLEDPDDQELFLIFDGTSKKTTYRAGQFLYMELPTTASLAGHPLARLSTAFTTILRIQCLRGLSTASHTKPSAHSASRR